MISVMPRRSKMVCRERNKHAGFLKSYLSLCGVFSNLRRKSQLVENHLIGEIVSFIPKPLIYTAIFIAEEDYPPDGHSTPHRFAERCLDTTEHHLCWYPPFQTSDAEMYNPGDDFYTSEIICANTRQSFLSELVDWGFLPGYSETGVWQGSCARCRTQNFIFEMNGKSYVRDYFNENCSCLPFTTLLPVEPSQIDKLNET